MTIVQSIRKEFNQSFHDVVRGVAGMGYSRRMTAAILDISPPWFNLLCVRFGLNRHFIPHKRRTDQVNFYRGPRPWVKGRARTYSDEYLLAQVRRHPSTYMFAEQTGVSITTVKNRFKKPWREIARMAKER